MFARKVHPNAFCGVFSEHRLSSIIQARSLRARASSVNRAPHARAIVSSLFTESERSYPARNYPSAHCRRRRRASLASSRGVPPKRSFLAASSGKKQQFAACGNLCQVSSRSTTASERTASLRDHLPNILSLLTSSSPPNDCHVCISLDADRFPRRARGGCRQIQLQPTARGETFITRASVSKSPRGRPESLQGWPRRLQGQEHRPRARIFKPQP